MVWLQWGLAPMPGRDCGPARLHSAEAIHSWDSDGRGVQHRSGSNTRCNRLGCVLGVEESQYKLALPRSDCPQVAVSVGRYRYDPGLSDDRVWTPGHVVRRATQTRLDTSDLHLDFRQLQYHLFCTSGLIAVARPIQGISPKYCTEPARRAEGFWRNVSSPQVRACRRQWRNPCHLLRGNKLTSGPSQAPGRYKAFRPSSAHARPFKRNVGLRHARGRSSEKDNVDTL